MNTPPTNPLAVPEPAKPVGQLAAEQGVTVPQDVNGLIGAGAGLWDTDEEFEAFQRWLTEGRREGA